MTPEQLQKVYEIMVIVCNRINTRPEDLNWGNRRLCEDCMVEYASIVSNEKDKEMAELNGYNTGIHDKLQAKINENIELTNRIAELEKENDMLRRDLKRW